MKLVVPSPIMPVVALLVAVTALPVEAASRYRACSLLTTAELETALRVKVSGTNERDTVISRGPHQGRTMSGCTWIMGGGYLSVSVFPQRPTEAPWQAALTVLGQTLQDLKRRGWSIEPAAIPGAECSTARPPARERGAGPVVTCFMERRGFALGLYAVRMDLTPLQVRTLGDRAASRLP